MAISKAQLRARAAQNRQRMRSAVNRFNASQRATQRKLQRELDRLRRACR